MDKSGATLPDITLERMRSFVRVAERGSLSAVARELRVGQSTITRHLRELETALGVPLMSRTTRRVTLTDEGGRYYANCLQILRLVDQASEEAQGTRGAPAGTIRLSCTVALGVRHVSHLLFAFQDRYPEIGIDLSLSDERVNLVREGVDIALRLGPLTDSSMKLRPLGASRRSLVGAPSYLQAHGRPKTPQDLAGHEGIRLTNVAGHDTLSLTGPNGARHDLPFDGRIRFDNGLAAREALIAGRGIGPTHLWLVDDALADGRLEQILPDWAPQPVPFNMLIVPDRAGIARVRLLVDYLIEATASIPGVEAPRSGR